MISVPQERFSDFYHTSTDTGWHISAWDNVANQETVLLLDESEFIDWAADVYFEGGTGAALYWYDDLFTGGTWLKEELEKCFSEIMSKSLVEIPLT